MMELYLPPKPAIIIPAAKELIKPSPKLAPFIAPTIVVNPYIYSQLPTPVQVTDASNVQSSSSTTQSVTLPGSLVSGNLLLVFGSTAQSGAVTTPSGWSLLFSETNAASERYVSFCFYKVSDGTEGATLSITVGTSSRGAYSSWQISGAGTPQEAHTEYTSATTMTPPSLSPSGGAMNYLWIAAIPYARSRSAPSLPSGYSSKHSAIAGTLNDNGHSCCVTCYKEANAATEDAGDFVFGSAAGGACAIVAVPPA